MRMPIRCSCQRASVTPPLSSSRPIQSSDRAPRSPSITSEYSRLASRLFLNRTTNATLSPLAGAGAKVDGIVQMGGRRPCQGLRIGPERRAVGEGKEETEVTARGVGDRGSRDEVTHGQRGAVWVRECGLLQGVADLQQLEMVDVFRFERLVAHFQADPAVPVRANPEPVDVTRLEGRAERVGEALRLERPRASAVGVDGRTVPEAIRG